MAEGLDKLAKMLGQKTVAKADNRAIAKSDDYLDDDDMFADDDELEDDFADEMIDKGDHMGKEDDDMLFSKGDDYDDDYDDDDDDDDDDDEIFAKAHTVDGTEVLNNIYKTLTEMQNMNRVMAKALMEVGNASKENRRQMQHLAKAVTETGEAIGNAPRVAKSGRRRPKSKGRDNNNRQVLAKAVDLASSNTQLFTATDVALLNSYANSGNTKAISQRFNTEQLDAIGLLKN